MCKHPLKAWMIGVHKDSGKPKYKITSYQIDHLNLYDNGSYKCVSSKIDPFDVYSYGHFDRIDDFIEIPCGKCIDCRLQYARQWADRCMYECKYYDENEVWFLTLTYDEDHLETVDDFLYGTLNKRHLQLFFKLLRRECSRKGYSDKIRYFACGEYGTTTHRPHYHVILYGLDLMRLGFENWIPSHSGHVQWRSPFLEKIWKNGLITVSKVSWDTCAYTARYVLKKATTDYDERIMNSLGYQPEFVTMSRRPGIGRQYLEDHIQDIYEFDEIILSSPDGGRKTKPPRYYDRLLESVDPDLYKKIKEKRKEKADYSKELKLSRTDLSYLELLQVEENVLSQKIKGLIREVV